MPAPTAFQKCTLFFHCRLFLETICTQSVRALLFDLAGRLVARQRVALDRYTHPRPNWVECDPDDFWRAVCEACARLWAAAPNARERLRGLVVTTQRATVINLDRDGRALRPAIVWADRRRAAQATTLSWWWEAAFRALGVRATIRGFQLDRKSTRLNSSHQKISYA